MPEKQTFRVAFTEELDPDRVSEWVEASFIQKNDVRIIDADSGDIVYDDTDDETPTIAQTGENSENGDGKGTAAASNNGP